MEHKQIIEHLGMGTRVLIVRARFLHQGTALMRLQVRRRFTWRTLSIIRVPEVEATHFRAQEWMHRYEQYPPGHFRRYP